MPGIRISFATALKIQKPVFESRKKLCSTDMRPFMVMMTEHKIRARPNQKLGTYDPAGALRSPRRARYTTPHICLRCEPVVVRTILPNQTDEEWFFLFDWPRPLRLACDIFMSCYVPVPHEPRAAAMGLHGKKKSPSYELIWKSGLRRALDDLRTNQLSRLTNRDSSMAGLTGKQVFKLQCSQEW
ncbi:hypothetical protein Micbo1qcDRAFT_181055 [Microdochium bolleyi]|uniref:Uncharacterized protein n=1 Tax=Microdochium bolleyi TaxID=196109 RepID=A0A136IKK7_9PEZI|nr:hypothetical protein Micbo1qcDRAFT_181055 [Microdochium bolleyi]